MAPETIQRAFEPFFTTKGPGRGSGLGLSMVYGFVTQSGGHIALDSTPGEGTRITIYLPATEQAEPSSRDARTPAAAVPTGTERILVVEDDDLVRRTVVHHFKNLGYRVLEADSGTAALEILQGKEPVDLLFTDVVMPGGLMGQELAAQASRLRPGLRILYTSGYTENSFLRDSPLDFGAVLLAKPYTREALAQQVRSVLDAKPRHTTP